MSGSPTEAEVQTQLKNTVAILESFRNHCDGTQAGGGGLIDALLQSLEGEYTPPALTRFAQTMRNLMSGGCSPEIAREALRWVFREYIKLVSNQAGVTDDAAVMRAIYEYFYTSGALIKSRTITFDTTATTSQANVAGGGTIVGQGVVSRLTVDEHNFPLEACHVEKKQLRCVRDVNTGADEHAEQFLLMGLPASQDNLLRTATGFGSGDRFAVTLFSKHAGSSQGGSLLRNSSFDEFSSSSNTFSGWTNVAGTGGTHILQDTTNTYRSNPSVATNGTNGSLKLVNGVTPITVRQAIEDRVMRIRELKPDVPYFLRIMVNKTIGTASGGNVVLRLGSVTVTTSIASLGSGWQEILVPIGTSCWARTFNTNPFQIDIEWASSSSGFLLVDDVLFCEWDFHDGTWWLVRQNGATPTPWKLDDQLEFTDTGGAPATGKLQYWLQLAGLGYLPASGSPTIADP